MTAVPRSFPPLSEGAGAGPVLRNGTEDPAGAELVADVRRRLAWLRWLATVGGAVVVFLSISFLIPIFLDPDERGELALLNGPLVAAFLVVAVLVVARLFDRHLGETLNWVVEGRAPDEREHRRTERVLASQAALSRADDGESATWSVTDSAVLRGREVATTVAHPRS